MQDDHLPIEFSGGCLRRLHPADLIAFQAYRGIPELGRYQGWSPMPEAEALAFLTDMNDAPLFTAGQWVQLGIADEVTDVLIGDIGLYLSDDETTGEIGFTLQPGAQGRGTASRAVRQAVKQLFSTTQITRVLGISDARNHASIRLLERLGFNCIETRQVEFHGEWCTELVFSLLRQSPDNIGV